MTLRRLNESYPSELVPRLCASGFPETFYLEKRVLLNLVIHNPIVKHFSQEPQHSCRRFLFFLDACSFSAFFFWLFINLFRRKQTLLFSLTTTFIFNRIGTRGGCQYSQGDPRANTFQMISGTVVEEWQPLVTFCLGYFSSSTHFDLVIRLAQKVWRHCVLVFAHDRYSHAGNCTGLLLIQFSRVWRHSFLIVSF